MGVVVVSQLADARKCRLPDPKRLLSLPVFECNCSCKIMKSWKRQVKVVKSKVKFVQAIHQRNVMRSVVMLVKIAQQ